MRPVYKCYCDELPKGQRPCGYCEARISQAEDVRDGLGGD